VGKESGMNAKVHYWVVSDAVSYIRNHGNEAQKKALQAFQDAYGENLPVQTIPQHQSAVERLAGFESRHTDKFGDLSLRIPALPWGAKSDVTGLGGRMFTAFNHFINPFSGTDQSWPKAHGYSYGSSSMRGIDRLVVQGISDHLHGTVDVDHSLVLERIEPFWMRGTSEWKRNFGRELVYTNFAPWTVLVDYYYSQFLDRHFEPLQVRGPNEYIAGLQLLGPVLHATTDASSPQHVRSVLGFGHHVWENYVQSRVYNREIGIDPGLIGRILKEEPFDPWLTIDQGPGQARFDVPDFVHRLSLRTADRLGSSTQHTWLELWQEGESFWKGYLTGTSVADDAHYLYHQAVAAAVHVIERACKDLREAGILSATGKLESPEKKPEIKRVQDEGEEMPLKRVDNGDAPPEETRPIPFTATRDILGFDPIGDSYLSEGLDQVRRYFSKTDRGKRETPELAALRRKIEESLIGQYRAMESREGAGFCPLRMVEKIPLDSDISAHFGTSTFRLPSSEECNDPELLSDYIDLLDTHAEMAHKMQLTQVIAGLKFYTEELNPKRAHASRIGNVIAAIEKERDGRAYRSAGARKTERVTVARARTPVRKEPLSERIGAALRSMVSALSSVPVPALATAAVAVLVAVLLIPRGPEGPRLALSPVQWQAPGLTLMTPKALLKSPLPPKPKLFILLYFKGFELPPNQGTVNRYYRAMHPPEKLLDRFDVVSPSALDAAVKRGEVNAGKRPQLLSGLHDALGITDVLAVTVAAVRDRFRIEGERINLRTGNTVRRAMDRQYTKSELVSALGKAVPYFLQSDAPKH
jgi:hypothetical protein